MSEAENGAHRFLRLWDNGDVIATYQGRTLRFSQLREVFVEQDRLRGEVIELRAERDRLAARVAELEGELADAREANRNMRDAVKRRREGQPCGSPLVHAPHHWMLAGDVMNCPGNAAAPDRAEGSER